MLTDDDTNESMEAVVVKPLVSPKTAKLSNFVFSPVNSSIRKSYHQADQKTNQSPLLNGNINVQHNLSNSATKRRLDLNNLIDQMPDTDFIKINDTQLTVNSVAMPSTSLFQFKSPLTEHQKEMKKAKSFMPSEIHNVCIDLTSSLIDPNQSMSCTLDFDESNPAPLNKTTTDTCSNEIKLIEDAHNDAKVDISNISDDSFRNSKRTRVEASPKDGSKIQFHSKIKPNKHIEAVSMVSNEEESNNDECVIFHSQMDVSNDVGNHLDLNVNFFDENSIQPSQRRKSNSPEGQKNKIVDMPLSNDTTNDIIGSSQIEAPLVSTTTASTEAEKQEQEEKVTELPKIRKRRYTRRPNTVTVLSSDIIKAQEIIISKTPVEVIKMPSGASTDYDNNPDIQELNKQEEEKINEIPESKATLEEPVASDKSANKKRTVQRRSERRANTITVMPSAIKEAQDFISKFDEVSSLSSQDTIDDEHGDNPGPRRTKRITTSKRLSIDNTIVENEEISISQSDLFKPNKDKRSRIMKRTNTSLDHLSPSNTKQQKKSLKTKISLAIDKLKEGDVSDEKGSTTTEALFEDICKSTTSEKRKSTRLSMKRTSNANEDKYEKDIKIDDPFSSSQEDSQVEKNTVVESLTTVIESKEKCEVVIMETEECTQVASVREVEEELIISRPLEAIPENTTDTNDAKSVDVEIIKHVEAISTNPVEDSIVNIQFVKQINPSALPTVSILKKRRSANYNLNDLASQNDTPSKVRVYLIEGNYRIFNIINLKRRVSFCESVQIEEIEANNNAKSVLRTTPKVAPTNRAKLVLTPYFNKSPTNVSSQSSLSECNSLTNSPQSIGNHQKVFKYILFSSSFD